jgi:hypothetical protein
MYFKKSTFLVLFLAIVFAVGAREARAQLLFFETPPCFPGFGYLSADPYCSPPPLFKLAFTVSFSCGSAAKTYSYGSFGYGSDNFCDLSLAMGSSAPVVVSLDPSVLPAFPSSGSSVSWMCDSIACAASQDAAPISPINGSCGTADGIIFPSISSNYGSYTQCSDGTPSDTSFPSAGNTVAWTCSGVDGGSASPACSASRLSPIPTVDLKINGSDGPVPLSFGDTRIITWTSTDATSCEATSSDGFAGPKSISSGSTPELRGATVTSDHALSCTGPGGSASDSVQVNVSCTPITGVYGACDCPTETKTRTNTLVSCLPSTETTACDASEKNACRDYNWKEIAP